MRTFGVFFHRFIDRNTYRKMYGRRDVGANDVIIKETTTTKVTVEGEESQKKHSVVEMEDKAKRREQKVSPGGVVIVKDSKHKLMNGTSSTKQVKGAPAPTTNGNGTLVH